MAISRKRRPEEDRLTESQSRPDQETAARIAAAFAGAFAELQRSVFESASHAAGAELQAARAAIEEMGRRIEHQLDDDRDQRRLLGDQVGALAGSLERLVTHLQGLSQLMGDLLERLAEPSIPAVAAEAAFQPGGEGLTVVLTGVPGFQGLMEIQKALAAMEQVAGASVERYQEGDSRMLLHLGQALTASQLTAWIRSSTQYAATVEESKPELSRLRLKITPVT